MKKKIGEIYNKPIIEGDINLNTPYEIHKSELVDVSQSGEGDSTWRYFDVSNIVDKGMIQNTLPFIAKAEIITSAVGVADWTQVNAIAVDDGIKLYPGPTFGLVTWSQMMEGEGLTPEVMAQVGIVEITESEFYNLES